MQRDNDRGHQPYQVCAVIVFFLSGYVSFCVHDLTLGELNL